MAVVGYARVSSEDQDLTVQIEQLKAAGCAKIFSEKRSGSSRERPELDRCLTYVRDGDTLMVTRIDRLARSLKDFSDIVADLTAREVLFKCLLQPVESGGPAGTLMMQMLAAFAEFEAALRRERQAEGIAKAKEAGVYTRKVNGHTPQEWSAASRLLKRGLSYVQVSEVTGLHEDALRKKFPEYAGKFKRGRPPKRKKRKSRPEPLFPAKPRSHPPSAVETVESDHSAESAPKKPGFLGKLLGPRQGSPTTP